MRKYETPDLRALRYTESDVDELARLLVDEGFPAANVRVMTQTRGAEEPRLLPVAAKVRKELELFLGGLGENDRVIVALAGHGVQFARDDEGYFCPADAQLNDKSTLIPPSQVHEALTKCGAGFKLLLVDACRNDPLTQLGRDAGRPVVDLPSLSRPLKAREPGGVAVLLSCSTGQRSFEHPDLQHGVLFNFVIQGLKGEADTDGDRKVDLAELMSYTTRRVYRYVEGKLAEKQMPEFLGKTNMVELVSLDSSRKEMPEFITTKLGQIQLKRIPAGEFVMGSPDDDKDALDDEKPQHRVRITRPFYLGTYELTQAQYEAVMGENPSRFSATGGGKEKVAGQSTDQHPVEQVSWVDAVRFCNKLSEREGMNPFYQIKGEDVSVPQWKGSGYRLPTEAEWEYACRAGSKTWFSFGDEQAGLGEHGWFAGNAGSRHHPVGQLVPNGFGLYDMHGNVWEWCWDGYGENPYAKSPADDPTGPIGAALRVFRGGGWGGIPRGCRSADRGRRAPGTRISSVGFRLALVQYREQARSRQERESDRAEPGAKVSGGRRPDAQVLTFEGGTRLQGSAHDGARSPGNR